MKRMKIPVVALAMATGIAAAIPFTPQAALGHGPQGGGSQWMGIGWGPGMMGQGMMGPGMMGQGQMPMMGQGQMEPLPRDLSVADVRHILELRLDRQGNPNLRLGNLEEKDGHTVIADIVTQDGSLVQRLEIDRHTGLTRPTQ